MAVLAFEKEKVRIGAPEVKGLRTVDLLAKEYRPYHVKAAQLKHAIKILRSEHWEIAFRVFRFEFDALPEVDKAILALDSGWKPYVHNKRETPKALPLPPDEAQMRRELKAIDRAVGKFSWSDLLTDDPGFEFLGLAKAGARLVRDRKNPKAVAKHIDEIHERLAEITGKPLPSAAELKAERAHLAKANERKLEIMRKYDPVATPDVSATVDFTKLLQSGNSGKRRRAKTTATKKASRPKRRTGRRTA